MSREFKNKFLILKSVMDTKKDMSELVDALTEYVIDKWSLRYEDKYCLKIRSDKTYNEQERVNIITNKEI